MKQMTNETNIKTTKGSAMNRIEVAVTVDNYGNFLVTGVRDVERYISLDDANVSFADEGSFAKQVKRINPMIDIHENKTEDAIDKPAWVTVGAYFISREKPDNVHRISAIYGNKVFFDNGASFTLDISKFRPVVVILDNRNGMISNGL